MMTFSSIFSSVQILGQLIVYFLAFYWTDIDLLCYFLETQKSVTVKFFFIFFLVTSQLFLLRNFYLCVSVTSYVEESKKKISEIDENNQINTCKKCSNKKPKRAHHCSTCKKCVEQMDHHCYMLNNCIGGRNYKYFMGYIFLICVNSLTILWISVYAIFLFMERIQFNILIKYIVLGFVAFICSVMSLCYLCFHFYLQYKNLTTLEFIYPKLREIDDVKNKNNKEDDKDNRNILSKILELIYP